MSFDFFLWSLVVILAVMAIFKWRLRTKKPSCTTDGRPSTLVLTADELARFDGTKNERIYIAIKSKIYDVTKGREFYGKTGSYSAFAGRECARALATMSLDPEDIGSENLDGLNANEISTLNQWIKKFDSKYPIVGTVAKS